MSTLQKHWDEIFSAASDPELGWYESEVSQTLKFINLLPRDEIKTVFLPGAGTSLLVDELLSRNYRIILNDISTKALKKLEKRIGIGDNLIWLRHDISQPIPSGISPADLWIDRAVLHFLLDETDIAGYFANLHSAVRAGGYALLAEFSTNGAVKCAGLNVHRYSLEEMNKRMGPSFRLIKHEYYTYINPEGGRRPYLYALYQNETATGK